MKLITTKENDTGIMKVFENDTNTLYEILTFAEKYRGGKIYFADKKVEILSGTAEITLEKNGQDEEVILTPEDGEYIIPARVPNLFYFPEETEMREVFPKGTQTENFERYREMKD